MAQGYYYGDAERNSIERQQAMLDALGAKPIAPQGQMVGGRYVAPGWAGALAEALGGAMRGYGNVKLDEQRKALDTDINQRQEEYFGSLAKPTPAVPMQPGTLPREEALSAPLDKYGDADLQIPGREPVLGSPEVPVPQERRLQDLNRGARLGGLPAAYAAASLKEITDPLMAVGSDLFDKSSRTWVGQSPTALSVIEEKKIAAQNAYEAKLEQIRTTAKTAEERIRAEAQAKRERDDTLKLIAAGAQETNRIVAAGRREDAAARLAEARDRSDEAAFARDPKNHLKGDLYGINGEEVMSAPDGGKYTVKMVGGKAVPTPYEGVTIPRSAVEKEVMKLQPLVSTIQEADRLVGVVQSDPSAFGPIGQIGKLPWVGPALIDSKYTKEQNEKRAEVASALAERIKNLLGTAQTAGEVGGSVTWRPEANDPPELLAAKLEGAKKWAKTHAGSYSSVARRVSGMRTDTDFGGGENAPAAGGGKTVVEKRKGKDGKVLVKYSDGSIGEE